MHEEIKKTSPRDVFLHLLAIITLYVSAVSFGVLWFQYVNVLIPDVLQGDNYYAYSGVYQAMRWSIASLIIVFPAYLWTSWFLNKAYIADPAKRNIRIRKWLVYFTLFAAALIMLGDLVRIVYNLLNGELTARFVLKVIVVFFIAGSVFIYYFWDLKKHKTE